MNVLILRMYLNPEDLFCISFSCKKHLLLKKGDILLTNKQYSEKYLRFFAFRYDLDIINIVAYNGYYDLLVQMVENNHYWNERTLKAAVSNRQKKIVKYLRKIMYNLDLEEGVFENTM